MIDLPEAVIIIYQLDLASLQSIRDFVLKKLAVEEKIDILINNAGVLAVEKQETEEGYELNVGVNFVGTFYLTLLLIEKLKAATAPRVVIVSSVAHLRK